MEATALNVHPKRIVFEQLALAAADRARIDDSKSYTTRFRDCVVSQVSLGDQSMPD